jgi:hypothetical protein
MTTLDKYKFHMGARSSCDLTPAQVKNQTHEIVVNSNGVHKVRCVECFTLSTRNCNTWCTGCTSEIKDLYIGDKK